MSNRDLLLLGLIGLLAFGSYKWFERDQSLRRQRAALEAREAVQRALEKPVSLVEIADSEQRLGDVLKHLQAHCAVPILHDLAEWKNVSADADTRINVPATTLPLRFALELVLEPIDLSTTVRQGSLLITTVDAAEKVLTAHFYRLPHNNEGADIEATAEEWHDLICATIRPADWDYVGGRGHIEAIPGALMVVATEQVHYEVRGLLAQFAAPPPVPSGAGAYLHFASAEERRIYAALEEKESVFFVEMPLLDVVKYFSDQHGIPIVLNSKRLEEAAISVDIPITRTLRGISLRSVLNVLLDDLDLTYVIRNGVLVITTPEDAERRLRSVAYDARELVATSDGSPDFDSLIDLITSTVSPQSWDEVGGPGSVESIGNAWIVFSQTDAIHEEVAALLAGLREGLPRVPEDSRVVATTVFPGDLREDARVRQALERPVEFDFAATAIKDVCAYLEEECKVNVVLDAKRLEESAISVDTPIDCQFPPLPLRTALHLLLEPLELVAIPTNEMLLITTPEGEERLGLSTRLYDVRGLSSGDDGDRLVQLITTVIGANSWDQLGGPGSINDFRGLLVVRNSQAIHRDLEALLKAMQQQLEVVSPKHQALRDN